MDNAQWALQKAVYTALKSSLEIVSRLGDGIYDDVPRKANYPYVSFGQSVERDLSSSLEDGSEHSITLHLWSGGKSRKLAFEIMDRVCQVLEMAALPMNGHHLVNMRCELSRVSRDPSSQSFHGVLRFRVVLEQS